MEDKIKEAFSRVKQDIFSLGEEMQKIKLMMSDMRNELKILTQAFNDMREKDFLAEKTQETAKTQEKTQETAIKNQIYMPTQTPTHLQKVPTIQQITPTHNDIPTDKLLSYVLKRQKTEVSTGNQGVPTNKQTNKQTNQHIIQHIKIEEKPPIYQQLPTTTSQEIQEKPNIPTTTNHFDKVTEILNTLDSLKKEIRLKFKRLTSQEIAVFSLLYSLEEQGNEVDYPLLAEKLKLSEASIRDYILKLQKKGVPIIKEKLNNKRIILHISQELKKIASLDTILKLREL